LDGDVPDIFNQLIPSPKPALPQHPRFNHCKPPVVPKYNEYSVFTAGSIEMGAAVQWQERLVTHVCDLPITVCNPRRGTWDPNVDVKSSDPDFRDQVEWELEALQEATVICFFFDQDTLSPVTMLELGLQAKSRKVIMCCGEKFWRSGNVDMVCNLYNIPWVRTFEQLVPAVRAFLCYKGLEVDENDDVL
ncbi:hypothetical protein EK21DRAFT_30374, partial [Setomelanomma holmii]